jgi:hypothetical protein
MDWLWMALTTVAMTVVLLCVTRGRRLPGELEAVELERWLARNAKRLWVLLAGTALILGPLGIAMLATEFVWARRLMRELDRNARGFNTGVNWFARRVRLGLAVFLFASFITGAAAIGISGRMPSFIFWPCTSIGLTIISIVTIRSWRRYKRFVDTWRVRRDRQGALARSATSHAA